MLKSCLRRPWLRSQLQRSFANQPSDKSDKIDHDDHGKKETKFGLVEEKSFADFDIKLQKYFHVASGLVHYHLAAKDPHKCLAFVFNTPSEDLQRKPRSLEMMIQCGSEKYPVRDPFAHMTTRSMNSMIDAWTGPDFTAYAFSTTNDADFNNLLQVYMTSISLPAFNKLDFLNTVWRPEFANIQDPRSPLSIRGQAFQEQKGLEASPDIISAEAVLKHLFKGSSLSNPPRGSLESLPEITLETLRHYHQKVYGPAGLTLFTYGDIDPINLHHLILENYMPKFDSKIETKEAIDTFHKENQVISVKSPPRGTGSASDFSSSVSIGWRCDEAKGKPIDCLALNLVSTLLFELPTSPFYQKGLAAGLGNSYVPSYGFEQNIKTPFFVAGFGGVIPGKENEVLESITSIIKQVVDDGFDKQDVLQLLAQVEVQARQSRLNFGADFLQSYIGAINWRQDSIIHAGLDLKKHLAAIKAQIQAGKPFLESIAKKYLLENPKKVSITQVADENYLDDLETRVNGITDKIAESLDKEKRLQVCDETVELEEELTKIQNIDCLPRLALKDFSKQTAKTHYAVEQVQKTNVYFFEVPTRGLVYFRMKIEVSSLGQEAAHYLYLASLIFKRIGTFSLKPVQVDALRQLYLTDLDFALAFEGSQTDPQDEKGFALLSASCLEGNIDKLFDILGGLLTEPDFKDLSHLSRVIKLEAEAAATRLASDPQLSSISFNERKTVAGRQLFNSLDADRFIVKLAASLQKSLKIRPLLEQIEKNIARAFITVLKRKAISFSVHGPEQARDSIRARLTVLLQSLASTYRGSTS